jgi:hypothetical protein
MQAGDPPPASRPTVPVSRPPLAAAPPPFARPLAGATFAAAVAVITLAGLYVRLVPALAATFPLNDGGLFYQMTEELRANGYRLPAYSAYNSAGIPFAYPPLGFYLLGALHDVGGVAVLDGLRLLPAVISTLTIPAFLALSRAVLGSDAKALIAAAAFAMLPRTWLWFIMGGGLTRSLGLLFVLLMLTQVVRMYRDDHARHVVGAIVFGSLAVMSHLENTWFGVYSALLMLITFGRNRRGVVRTLLVALGVALLSAPWWLTVAARHGLAPFLDAAASGGQDEFSLVWLERFAFTDEPYLSLLGVLGLIGVVACVVRGELLLPGWVLLIFLVNPRNPATPAAVPLAMLVAVGVHDVLLPGMRIAASERAPGQRTRGMLRRRHQVAGVVSHGVNASMLLLAVLALYAFLSARSVARNNRYLRPLRPADLAAMRWLTERTPEGSRVLVLTGKWFGGDPVPEWLPALTRRVSVATVQGYEWVPGRQFYTRWRQSDSLQACGGQDAACLDRWTQRRAYAYDYLYLDRIGARPLLESLRAAGTAQVVYDGDSVAVLVRRPGPAAGR